MADLISDESFERNVLRVHLLSEERIENARHEQLRMAQCGELVGLGEVLVRLGDLTPALRERIEKMPVHRAGSVHMLGPFKLLRKLGEGSMGAVYLALDTRSDRKIALKTLPKRYAEDSEFLVRFQREARAAQTIIHDNIVAAYESGEDQGYHYFAMEFCQGEPLDRVLEREVCLPWLHAATIIMQVARGLECAHTHGFIHRDVKPANIIIVEPTQKDGPVVAKLLDLGLTKNIVNSQSTFRTEVGALLGTPQYISPEQARGDEAVDGRSDIYSLGATFYHLVTGEAPFQATSAELVIKKHLSDPLSNPQDVRADIPNGAACIIQKMMAKVPGDRYRNCAELVEDLERVLIGKPPLCSPLAEDRTTVARRKAELQSIAENTSAVETLFLPQSSSRPSTNLLLGTWGLSRGKRMSLYICAAVAGFAIAIAAALYLHSRAAPVPPISTDQRPGDLAPGTDPSLSAVATTHPLPGGTLPVRLPAEVLIDEDFEAFDLSVLPENWTLTESGKLSIVPVPERGNALVITNSTGGLSAPGVTLALKIEKVRGRMIRIAVQACCPLGFAAVDGRPLAKPGLTLSLLLANGYHPPEDSRVLQPGDLTWKRLSLSATIPQNATEVKIQLNVPGVVAEVYFDDLKIELLPEN